ncbi:MAG: MCE family protein [Solirubrobacterales bacterium]|nr:MCE family protein [Solirubrobacterales bacterium]MBV9916376.1 MCE family protein [Solirubrobacterales bacterium]
MKRAIKNHAVDVAAIFVLLVFSVAVAGYILSHQRLRFPLIQSTPEKMYAEFATAQAVMPGQGQSVRVSGVQIGEIGGVSLRNGVAVVQMNINDKYKHLIHQDATALLRPRTGLKDMFIEVNPGSNRAPAAAPGFTIPVANTKPDVNLDEVLASLDADTRSYLALLVNGAGRGLQRDGGNQLAQVFERFEPTFRDLARVNQAVALRGRNLRRLVNSLQRLNTALAQKQNQIVRLVDSSSTVFRAFASQNQNLSQAIAELPGTLTQATDTLGNVQTFATLLRPTATNLLPAAQALPAANAALTALARPATPIVRDQIRPFVIAARPLVQQLVPASNQLAKATPNLQKTFTVVNHLVNMLGYSPGAGQHGYLWWLAWLGHNTRTLFSIQDANGPYRPLFIQFSCQQIGLLTGGDFSLVGALLNLAPLKARCPGLGASRDSTAAAATSARPATGSSHS